jgi:hypothetical protein
VVKKRAGQSCENSAKAKSGMRRRDVLLSSGTVVAATALHLGHQVTPAKAEPVSPPAATPAQQTEYKQGEVLPIEAADGGGAPMAAAFHLT